LGRDSQKWISVPYIRDATPFEYLRRIVLFNRVFGDVIQIEGVICDPGREAIVTSQPVIRGHAASDAEVTDAMQKLGFSISDCPPLGKNDVPSQSFYNADERVAVFDTHGENFLVGDSIVTPIDALIVVADEDLLRYMACSRAKRREEIGLQTSGLLGI
jgi:Serine/Threonine/Tyrosine Kinase found in polyvalent proteins